MTNKQSKPIIQIDDEVREMTDEEYSIYLESCKQVEATEYSSSKARESALAKLAKLGLTEEEIASL